jgi:hypothetical protein
MKTKAVRIVAVVLIFASFTSFTFPEKEVCAKPVVATVQIK